MCSQYMLDVHQIAEMPRKGQWLLFEECVRTHGLCTFSLFVCECFLFQPALGHCVRRPQLVICIAKTLLIKTNTFKAPIFALGLPYIVLVLCCQCLAFLVCFLTNSRALLYPWGVLWKTSCFHSFLKLIYT